jgi:hypothetical protein
MGSETVWFLELFVCDWAGEQPQRIIPAAAASQTGWPIEFASVMRNLTIRAKDVEEWICGALT